MNPPTTAVFLIKRPVSVFSFLHYCVFLCLFLAGGLCPVSSAQIYFNHFVRININTLTHLLSESLDTRISTSLDLQGEDVICRIQVFSGSVLLFSTRKACLSRRTLNCVYWKHWPPPPQMHHQHQTVELLPPPVFSVFRLRVLSVNVRGWPGTRLTFTTSSRKVANETTKCDFIIVNELFCTMHFIDQFEHTWSN